MEDVRYMNRSLCCVSDVFVRWILWFNGEGEQNESSTIVCDDLKDVNLSDISKGTWSLSSEFEIADYDTINDSLHVFRSEVEGCSSDHHRCRYRTIKIPVAKSLFMKVVHLTAVSDAKFPDMELYAVIRHLWLIIRNKSPFLRVFAQQLLNDPVLNNRLEAVHREVELNANQQTTHRKEAFFYDKLRDVVLEMSNSISLSVSDQFGSAAIASCSIETKPLVCASLQHIDRFFKPRYMRMGGYFLINNHDCLCRVYEDLSSGFGLTVDVDFSDVFYDVQKNHPDKMVSIKILTEKLSKTFNFRFFTFDCLEVCILRLAGVLEGLRFGNVQDKQMHIYCRESVFSSDMEMPSNLKVLSIVESKISCNLILPNSLEAITMEKVEIAENYELRVADACKRISIIGNAGRVRIPYVDRIFQSRFHRDSTVELLRSDSVIEKLTMIDATLPDCKIEVPENIREITLKRIRMGGKRPMILPKNIKKITIEDFKSNIRVHGLTFDIPLMCMLSAGSFCCSKTIENEELFEISISKAYISRSICFLPGVSTVNMSCVYINTNDFLNLNRNIKEVSLHNCVSGRICFESMPYFHQILLGFRSVPPSVLSMFYFMMPEQNFRFSRLDGKETYRLFISDFKIRETTQFGPEVEEFEFHDVIVSSSDYVAIDRSFKKLELNGCEGRFKIPGIFSDSESRTIEITIGVNRLVITKTAEDSYDVLVCFCSFRKLTIEMNIATAEFYDTTVIESLLITGQRCENLILDQFTGPVSIPNVTSFKKIELSCLEQLDMSSNACTLLDKSEATHFTLCNDPMSVSNSRRTSPEFGESAASINISAVLSDRCADICVLKCSIPINIIGVLRNATTNMSPLRVMPTDEFELVSSSPKNLTKLELVGNRIHGMWRVEKDVSFLSLSKVSSEEGSALYLNDGLENIRVHCSQLSIDATNAKNLRAITLINATSLVYNPSIHVSLSYLSVQEMTVSCNVDLTPCLHTFMLARSTLTPGFVIRVNERISHLSISKFIGVIDMSGVAGLGEMKMNDQHELYFDRRAVGKDGGSLHIVNCEFEKDVTFPDDLKIFA